MASSRVRFMLAAASAIAIPAWGMQAVTEASGPTAVEKVISLLEKLTEKTEADGKKEAAEYDKYSCFCKEQADQKIYQLEKSEKQIEKLTAEITALDTEITDLGSRISDLTTTISGLETDIETATNAREAEHATYLLNEANITNAVDAVGQAIEALEASKENMTDAKLAAFSQLEAVAKMPQASHIALLQTLVSQPEHASTYQSNDIIETLKQLQIDFKQQRKNLDESEFQSKSISEKEILGMTNEKTFAEKEKQEKEKILEYKTEEKNEKDKDKTEEEADKAADEAFKQDLTTACENAAAQFDQRSSARAAELQALSEATGILKSGVSPNYSANKKLVGLAAIRSHVSLRGASTAVPVKAVPKQVARAASARKATPASFVQIAQANSGSTDADKKKAVVHRVLQKIDDAATRLKSPLLMALSTNAALAEDHFVKVRGLIQDLIARLEQEALDEAGQKGFCDTEMARAIASRDTEKMNIEGEAATITKEEAKKAELLQEIAELGQEIAELQKSLIEATELRNEEKAANEQTVTDATDGKTAVGDAIQVLQDFYGSAFVQVKRQPAADREGNTVGDLAPGMSASGDYHGNQDASKGIFGLLEVIEADFERTITTVTNEETGAQTAYDEFKTETDNAISSKEGEKETKEGEVTTCEDNIVAATDAKHTAEGLHEAALNELEKLHPMCVAGEESYEERVAKREKEIEALKEAMTILEEWKN